MVVLAELGLSQCESVERERDDERWRLDGGGGGDNNGLYRALLWVSVSLLSRLPPRLLRKLMLLLRIALLLLLTSTRISIDFA